MPTKLTVDNKLLAKKSLANFCDRVETTTISHRGFYGCPTEGPVLSMYLKAPDLEKRTWYLAKRRIERWQLIAQITLNQNASLISTGVDFFRVFGQNNVLRCLEAAEKLSEIFGGSQIDVTLHSEDNLEPQDLNATSRSSRWEP